MNLKSLSEKANNLPLEPGCYIMKNDEGTVIYVGKAKKLKNRVSSYFHGSHLPKVEAMVEKIADFEIIIVKSEFEALILENSLIKKYQPHYNILLKDDKGYPFIRINLNDEYPKFSMVSKIEKDNADYYGPFGGRGVTKEIIDSINEALKLPDCSRKFPDSIGKERPCINYKIGICDGWCVEDKHEEYISRINQAVMIIDGNSSNLIENLKSNMYAAAEEQKFEYAAVLRDRIKSIEGLNNEQRVTKKGSSKYFKTQQTEDNNQIYEKNIKTLDELKTYLGLENTPRRIEAFDVSNLGNTGIVAAMTAFVDGKPSKKDYRKFRIKDISSPDDYYSMYQCVYRRYKHFVEGDEKFNIKPDLLLIDGGDRHAAVAENALSELDIEIPVFGMVKDSHHKTRALINSKGQEISISGNISLFSMIGRIQEETHRFAVEYQKSLRYENYGSELDKIPGIGNKRKADLLREFKSVKAIKEADVASLQKIVPFNVAFSIYNYFHGENK